MRIDRLAIKVTQLDSTVEEVSLQDIHMRKAFKSAVVFDQQIFSRATMPTAMLETYNSCDKPPPLDKLNCYRDDVVATRNAQRHGEDDARQGKKPHRPRTEGGQGNRHKKRVRQPHNTRERQKQIAREHGGVHNASEYDLQNSFINIMTPQQLQQQQQQPQLPPEEMMVERPPRPNSIEIRRSYQQEMPDGLHSPTYPPYEENPYQHGLYGQGPLSSESLYAGGTPTRGGKIRPSQPPPAPPSNNSTPSANTPTRGREHVDGPRQLAAAATST
ncbi:hypothetical protein NQ318_023038 [Aromia moschata]|uniref:Wiskott-Aldrich syndrome protein family member n=1 Tax=Aromia moschata TaxID=1265417 RepID=A0AAV8Y060_9CUCU|nr:hypothetical protein NQ318_023038 [Aromia moschata]